MKNKKLIIVSVSVLTILIVIILTVFLFKRTKYEKIIKEYISKIELKANLETEFLSDVKVSDFIESLNGKIIDDYKIDTTKVGIKEVKYKFINEDNYEIEHSYEINIKDTTPPLIWLNNTYNMTVGSEDNIVNKVLCGDNYDPKPKCIIEGDYDLNIAGDYKLVFKATDSSGNVTAKDFTLKVKEPAPSGNNSNNFQSRVTTNFQEVIANYKNESTQIGIDVSKWQGDIDFTKLKEAGVEFIMIRVGSTNGKDGEYFVDSKFEQNIKNANAVGIPVGIYFYSYASSKKRAIADAKWIIEQIKDYKVDLPIAFDWENWNSFNDFNLSFFGLTDMASGYMDTVKNAGYEGMLYSSKTYLEQIWLPVEYPKWLAHYTKNTSYEGDFDYWQMCSNGRVDGIDGDVDINIRYIK